MGEERKTSKQKFCWKRKDRMTRHNRRAKKERLVKKSFVRGERI